MGKHATLQVRVEDAMKAEAEQLFEALGLSLSEAVRLLAEAKASLNRAYSRKE